ncbi:hypothetical protein BH10ACT1_BH10ACT1_16930 [soil metagenome]
MATRADIDDFHAQPHLALVGLSRDAKSFSSTVDRALRDHGHQVTAVNPWADSIEGRPCVRTVADLPDGIGGAIVMVSADRAAGVVQECLDRGIERVWLHRGAGPSSVSDEAVALCVEHGVRVVDGACPLMFLEPTALIHRIHRAGRQLVGHLPR